MAKIKEFTVLKRFYSSEDGLFHIIKRDDSLVRKPIIDEAYVSFDEFYHAVNCDLSGIDLLKYNFDGIDLEKYNFENAIISSKIMQRLGIYDDRLYKRIEQADIQEVYESNELDAVSRRDLVELDEMPDYNDCVILYISDLHLTKKIAKHFEMAGVANEYEIRDYLQQIVRQLKETVPTHFYHDTIIIDGDVSLDPEIFKMFFKEYRKVIYTETIVVLGNHELWRVGGNSVEDIVEQYRVFLSSLGITLLENELYFPRGEKRIWSANEIIVATKEELREVWKHNGYAIFGGLGYAGLNDHFNYDLGIYRGAPLNRDLEIEKSKLVESLHEKLRDIASDKKLFFVTHNPKEDWTQKSYVKNWVYISGHTHHNYYCEDDEKTVYADNQIGNISTSYGFKFITTSYKWDIFCDFADGIYEISREDYFMFNYSMYNLRMHFRRPFSKLYMLKHDGYYMFLIRLTNESKLQLLNGGSVLNIGDHDVNYYFNNMTAYAKSISEFLCEYQHYQDSISRSIKKIGGSGRIHGCIVDIDYFNHLYVNIFDGCITPYYATSMTSKWVYENLPSLLSEKCPQLFSKYQNLMIEQNDNGLIPFDGPVNTKRKLIKDTTMYSYSRRVKSLQYLTTYNLIRFWDDKLLDGTKESGHLIVCKILLE